MARRASKVDESQKAIVDALRAASISVFSIAPIGRDVPDLVVSYRGFTLLVECKTGRAKLTPGQENFRRNWQGAVIVLRDPKQAATEFFTAWAIDRLGSLRANES